MATNNETTARELGGDNRLGLCPICKKGGKALVTCDPEGSLYYLMCCPDCSTKWNPCDRFEFEQAVSEENVGLIQECSLVVPEYGAGHPEELPGNESAMLSRVGEMIETLIVLDDRGRSIGECASRYLAILEEWRKETPERIAARSTCSDGGKALELLERIRRWILRNNSPLDDGIPF